MLPAINTLLGLIRTRLWLKILVALLLGSAVGVLIGPDLKLVPEEIGREIGNWLVLPGRIFIKLVQMIMIPLVLSSIILGLVSTDNMEQLRKMGLGVTIYFVITTTLSITIGLVLAWLIHPGDYLDLSQNNIENNDFAPPAAGLEFDSFPNFVSNLLPSNPLGSMVQGDMLAVVVTAVVFGLAVFQLKGKAKRQMVDLLESVQSVTMTVVAWAMQLAPLAVFGFLAQLTSSTGLDILVGMAVYVFTVIGGLLLMLTLYMIILTVVARRNPLRFLQDIKEVQLLAFSTSSSAAVMPLSIRTAIDKLKLHPSVAQFIVPIGATINMDGTALYQGVAAAVLAQAYGIELSAGALALMVLTVVLASIGTPATPGVGIIILTTVLANAGIPAEGLALLLGVDRILDMCRTTINVTGDLTASSVFHRFFGDKLPPVEDSSIPPAVTEQTSAGAAQAAGA